MAYDYEKSKSLYESMNKQQQQQFMDQNKNDANVQRFAKEYAAEKSGLNQTQNTIKNTTQNTGSTNGITTKTEYQGQGGATTKKDPSSSPYVNQGNGNYSYNPKSGYYEINQTSNNTSNNVSGNVGGTTTPKNDTYSQIRNEWDKLTYAQQQEKLKQNPNLRAGVEKVGGTFKTAPDQTTTETGDKNQTGNKGDGWDYQDNSPERMMQMADNVNRMAITDPDLFSSEEAFRNFFIDGKGRTPEQEKFLLDFYKNRQMYNKLDTYTSGQIGDMYVNGKIPDSYLNYLKNSNPERYAEVIDAKDKATDSITNQTYLNTVAENEGFDMGESSAIKWLKENGFLVDKDGNWVDDRVENQASDEEREFARQYADNLAEIQDLQNVYKNTIDELTEAYPGVPRATIIALANDRCTEIQKRIDELNVENTRLKGYVDYEQNERKMQNEAGQQTINNLQKTYGMYYDYSPEGMSELAQAQYAATNVTLDQADNGTDAQKQMALDSVLTDYFDKYGSIIQRSKSQVINDVMAYAKKNGVSLSQALEDNFLKYLRQKPEYASLSSGGISPKVSFEKVGDTGYVLTVNPDGTYSIESINGAGISSNGYNFTDYTPISSSQLESGLNDFMSDHPLNSIGGQCGSFVNDYLQSLGYDRLYTDPIDKKAAITNTKEPAVGSIAVMDSEKYPQYGHTAIVTAINGDKVKLLEANWGDDKKVHERWVNKSEITHGYFNPSLSTPNGNTTGTNNGYDPLLKDFFQKDPTKLTKDQWTKLKNMGYDERTYLSMRDNYLKNLSKEPDVSTVKILDTLGYLMTNYPGRTQLMSSIGTKYLPTAYGEKMGDYLSYVDYIKQNLTMDNLTKLKANGATFGSLTEGEWPRIEASATRLNNTMSEEKFIGELLDIYNTYAKNSGMGELTLDDINNMYGGTSTSSGVTIKPMKGMEQTTTTINNNGDVDRDSVVSAW